MKSGNILQTSFKMAIFIDRHTTGIYGYMNVSLSDLQTSESLTNASVTVPTEQPCVYRLSSQDILRGVAYMFGVVLNGVLIVTVFSHKRTRTITYLTISFISLADFVFMLSSLVYLFTVAGHIDKKTFRIPPNCPAFLTSKSFEKTLSIAITSSYLTSSFHIPYLYIIRYMILVHSLWAKLNLTKTIVTVGSLTIWLVNLAFVIPAGLVDMDHESKGVVETVEWVINYPLVTSIAVVIHLLKVRAMRKISMTGNKPEIKRMNYFVTAIIGAYIVLCMPWNVLRFLFFFGTISISYDMWFYCGILLVLNSCINPIVYGFMSNPCRRRLKCPTKKLKYSHSESYSTELNRYSSGSVNHNSLSVCSVVPLSTPESKRNIQVS